MEKKKKSNRAKVAKRVTQNARRPPPNARVFNAANARPVLGALLEYESNPSVQAIANGLGLTRSNNDFYQGGRTKVPYFRTGGDITVIMHRDVDIGNNNVRRVTFQQVINVEAGMNENAVFRAIAAQNAVAREQYRATAQSIAGSGLDNDNDMDIYIDAVVYNQSGRMVDQMIQDPDLLVDVDQDNLDDIDIDDIVGENASHQYQPVQLEQFAIRPLVMRDFSCIYESLCIIKYIHDNGGIQPNINLSDWRMYVIICFNNETFEDQQIYWGQIVPQCLIVFRRKNNIDVGLFNAYRFKQEFEKACLSERLYYLVYWGEHVFPCIKEKLVEVSKYQEQFIKNFNTNTNKNFCLIPSIFATLYYELRCYLLDTEARYNVLPCGQYLFDNYGELADIFTAGLLLWGDPYDHDEQQQILQGHNERVMGNQDNLLSAIQRQVQEDYQEEDTRQKLIVGYQIFCLKQPSIFYTPDEKLHYNRLVNYIQAFPFSQQHGIAESLRGQNRLLDQAQHRKKMYLQKGRAAVDLETYTDNDPSRKSNYNMIPFCATLVGDLQQLRTIYVTDEKTGKQQRKQKVFLVEGIREVFTGLYPKECIRKLIRFLMDNNYCYTQDDYRDLNVNGAGAFQQKRLYNYIFAHNGFGFDFRFMYEELHSYMREFKIVGDINQTKSLSGNGLFFFDFSLIYREKLSNLARTFFPNDVNNHKLDSSVVIGLKKDDIQRWHDESILGGYSFEKHPRMAEIIEYCMRDSEVLIKIVNAFFQKSYTTPYGHSFLPKPFYHSLSQLAYKMFTECYLRKSVFINKEALAIEMETKQGGVTGANSNIFGIGVFIDENSFYPAVMKNSMPVTYVKTMGNPYETLTKPLKLTSENYKEIIEPQNIYRIIFKFDQSCKLPCITQRSLDTLVLVLQSDDYDTKQEQDNAKAIYVFGYSIIVAIEECEGTEIILFGVIRYFRDEKIFKDFIEDQYSLRQECKKNGDMIGDKFHKNIMNSAQGKLGQKIYAHVKFGSITVVRDTVDQLRMCENVKDIEVKQILSDDIDLFEIRWSTYNDLDMNAGNTVRLPSFIMSVARSQLLRIQNTIARAYGNPDVIAYYDTDSVLTRFDLVEDETNREVQRLFDIWLDQSDEEKDDSLIQLIGKMIQETAAMKTLRDLEIQDVTCIDIDFKSKLLDEDRLGACKIEKYVIRGIALGAKQYGVYYMETRKDGSYSIKVTTKIKGIRAEARSYKMLEEINRGMQILQEKQDFKNMDPEDLPIQISDIMDKWSRMGAGAMISEIRKMVRPTLTKRRHDIKTGTSIPFKDIESFQMHKDIYETQAKQMKEIFQSQSIVQRLTSAVCESDAYKQLQQANKNANSKNTEAKIYFKESLSKIVEARKRYLIRLQKIKYDQLQDLVLKLILDNREEIYQLLGQYMNQVYQVVYISVLHRKSTSRKGSYDFRSRGQNFKDQEVAQIITFMLLIYYIIKKYKIENVSDSFLMVCEHLQKTFIQKLLQIEQNQKSTSLLGKRLRNQFTVDDGLHRWNYCLVYAFEFLSAGICITEITEQQVDQIGLDKKTQFTTLWRFFNNFQQTFQLIRDAGASSVIDTEALKRDISAINQNTAIVNGRYDYMENFLVNNYDVINLVNTRQPNKNDLNIEQKDLNRQQRGSLGQQMLGTFAPIELYQDFKQRCKFILQQKADSEELELKKHQNRVLSIMLTAKDILAVPISEDYPADTLYDTLQIYMDLHKVNSSFMQQIYHLATNSQAKIKVDYDDVVDIMLLLSFLYHGKVSATQTMCKLVNSYETFYKNETPRTKRGLFIKTCRVLFARPEMFKIFSMPRMSKKLTLFYDGLLEITIIPRIYDNDDQYLAKLQGFICNKEYGSPQLQQLIFTIKEQDDFKRIGQDVYYNIMKWRKPTKEMCRILCGILLMEDIDNYETLTDSEIYNQIFTEPIFKIQKQIKNNEKAVVGEQEEEKSRDAQGTLQEGRYFQHFMSEVDLNSCQISEALMDNQEWQQLQQVERELDLEEQDRYLRRLACISEQQVGGSDSDSSQIINTRRKTFTSAARRYFELEAEEGSESSMNEDQF